MNSNLLKNHSKILHFLGAVGEGDELIVSGGMGDSVLALAASYDR